MLTDFFLNILIIGTFLLLTGYIFRSNPSDAGPFSAIITTSAIILYKLFILGFTPALFEK